MKLLPNPPVLLYSVSVSAEGRAEQQKLNQTLPLPKGVLVVFLCLSQLEISVKRVSLDYHVICGWPSQF